MEYFSTNEISGIKGILKPDQLNKPYQMLATPSSLIVDREGIVRDTWIGPLNNYEELERRILPFLDLKKLKLNLRLNCQKVTKI
jgi:hypothetical protein